MTQALLSFAFTTAYFISAEGIGRLVSKERAVAINFGVGQAILILCAILGGLLHILSPIFLTILILAPAAISLVFKPWRYILRQGRVFFASFSHIEKVLLFLLVAPPLLQCFTPILGDQGHDTLRYHWSVILQFLYEERFVFCPDIFHGNGPLSLEMSFLPYLALDLENGARLHGWLFFILLGVSAFGVGAESLGRQAPLLPLLIWGTPLISRFANNGFIDVGLSFFGVCTLRLFRAWLSRPSSGRLIVSLGLCAGTMMGSKYTALFFLFGFLLFALGVLVFCQTRRPVLPLILVISAAGLFGGFWYLRNAVNLHNPVFPAAHNLFPTLLYSREQLQIFHDWMTGRSLQFGKGPLSLLLFPWNFTMYGDRFQNWMSVTPIYIAALPLMLRQARELLRLFAPEITVLLVFSLFLFYTFHEARFFSPAVPLAALFCVRALSEVLKPDGSLRNRFWSLFILLNLTFSAALLGREAWKSMPTLFKRVENISAKSAPPFYAGYAATNRRVKKGEKVLLIFGGGQHGSVHYYVKARSVMLDEGNPEILGLETANPESLDRYLRWNRIRYILDMNPKRPRPLIPPSAVTLESSEKGEGWVLYGMGDSARPPAN